MAKYRAYKINTTAGARWGIGQVMENTIYPSHSHKGYYKTEIGANRAINKINIQREQNIVRETARIKNMKWVKQMMR